MERREFPVALTAPMIVVTHEYSPTTGNDPIKELAKAMEICTV